MTATSYFNKGAVHQKVSSVSKRSMMLFIAWLGVLCLTGGCTGGYEGTVFLPAVQKVVLFDIDGPNGAEFTDMLSIQLTAACKNGLAVVRARALPNLSTAADIANPDSVVRDLGAQAYIKGTISAGTADAGKYTIIGTFQLYDPHKEGLVGGIATAAYTGKRDPPSVANRVGGGNIQGVTRTFAARMAKQLAVGLGH